MRLLPLVVKAAPTPVNADPSPINEVAVTFPPTTMLLDVTNPVISLVNCKVFEVVFPVSVFSCKVDDNPVS